MYPSLFSLAPRASRRPAALGVLLALAAVAGCSDLLVTPAPDKTAALSISFHVGPSLQTGPNGGVVEAFDKANAVRVRIEREGSPAMDTTLVLPPPAEVRRAGPLVVQMRQAVEEAEVSFDLMFGESVLFRGNGPPVELRAGAVTQVEMELTAVPGGVSVPESVPDVTSLRDTVRLSGAVVFASGDAIPGLAPSWSTLDPTIVEVSADGQLVALAEGDARVVASYGEFNASLVVRVRPVVARVDVEPAVTRLEVGQTRQLTATMRDARGNALANRTVQSWSSSDAAIASVDGSGLVRGIAAGEAMITATSQGVSGSATVRVDLPPPPGADVVVFNDINIFDNVYGFQVPGNPGNVRLVRNLVVYSAPGLRNAGTVVWFDRGRNSRCGGAGDCNDGQLSRMRQVITDAGMTITNIMSTAGSIGNIPANVKVIFLWNPMVTYTVAEVNALKRFASEGGRIIFVGEHQGYYGAGIPIQNQFLESMGATLRNTGGAVDCGLNVIPAESFRPHQITEGVSSIDMACASVIQPGPGDYPIFYDRANRVLLAGVAQIDTTPIVTVPTLRSTRMGTVDALVQPASPSGR